MQPVEDSEPRGIPLRIEVLCLCIFVAGFVLLSLMNFSGFDEDAFISFRYAENLAQGHGPLFNPGERTEGFSDPLWVFILASLNLMGLPIPACALVLGILFAAASGAALFYMGKSLDPLRPGLSFISVALLFTNLHYIIWAPRGLENALVALLITLTCLCYIREMKNSGRPWTAVFMGLLAISRPEAALVGIAVFIDWLLDRWPLDRSMAGRFIRSFYPFFVILLGYELFRMVFYHDLFPNSFYFKVESRALFERLQSGVIYLLSYFICDKWYVLFLILIGLRITRRRVAVYHVCGLTLILYSLFIIFSGGDLWFKSNFRFVTFFLPILYFMLGEGLRGLWERTADRPKLFYCILTAVFLIHLFLYDAAKPFYQQADAYRIKGFYGKFRQLALSRDFSLRPAPLPLRRKPFKEPAAHLELLRDAFTSPWKLSLLGVAGHDIGDMVQPGKKLATTIAGNPPFFSGLTTLDLLGLNDKRIAKGKVSPLERLMNFEADYVLVVHQAWGGSFIDTPVVHDPSFKDSFRLRKMYISESSPGSLLLFEKRGRKTRRPFNTRTFKTAYGPKFIIIEVQSEKSDKWDTATLESMYREAGQYLK